MNKQTENMPRDPRITAPVSRRLAWFLGAAATVVAILFAASFFIDERLRRITENKINRDLKGYSVTLPGLHVRLIDLSLTLKGLTVRQQAHPDPAIAYFPSIKASIHWREIFAGKIFAEFRLDEPKLHINLQQLHNETTGTISLKERGWQQAVEDIYPLKINSLEINNASVTYIDEDPQRPLVLSSLNLQASNIRNVHLPDKVYPSTFHIDTAIFGDGHGTVDGKANFLGEPIPGIKARIKLEKIPVGYFKPVFARANLSIHGGVLGASGDVEYAQNLKIVHLEELAIQGMKLDYFHSKKTAAAETKRADSVGKTVKKLGNKPDVLISVDTLHLVGCNLGIVNETVGKKYRIFVSDTDFRLSNFSNQLSRGPAKVQLHGKFMGSGVADVTGEFRPGSTGPDLNLHIKIGETQMVLMNDLLRAYGHFDVSEGFFSLVSELRIKNAVISGYFKPFFKDMNIYDRQKDKGKSFSSQAYEIMVGSTAKLLENSSRQQVATRANIYGSLKDPETSTWQIVGQVIKNGFFSAILPNFEKGRQ